MKRRTKWIVGLSIGGILFIAFFLLIIASALGGGSNDPDCSNSDGGSFGNIGINPDQLQVAQYMFNYFKAKGMDDAHICAIIGYADYESGGLVPSKKQEGDLVASETGWGLFQVTPIDRLKNFARNKGLDWQGVEVQLEYAWTELHHAVATDGTVTNGPPDWFDLYQHGVSLEEWWGLTDVSDICGIYTDCFGRGAISHNSKDDPHVVAARKWYGKFAGTTPTMTGGEVSGSSSTEDNGGGCGVSDNSNSKGGAKAKGSKLSYYDDLEPWLAKWLNQSPYNYGGAPTNLDHENTAKGVGTDCSGFVGWAFGKIGIHFSGRPTTFSMTDNDIEQIAESEAKAGDLIFFGDPTAPHHVGVYVGGGEMINDQDRGIVREKIWTEQHNFARVKGSLIPSKYK